MAWFEAIEHFNDAGKLFCEHWPQFKSEANRLLICFCFLNSLVFLGPKVLTQSLIGRWHQNHLNSFIFFLFKSLEFFHFGLLQQVLFHLSTSFI